MKIAHLDCSTGIAGDMTIAALLDCGVDRKAVEAGIASLKLPGVELKIEPVVKSGFRSTYVRVDHPEQHAHRHLSDIEKIIGDADAMTADQKSLALRIFEAVGVAEA
ncbi:MAG: nickel insertion protein, partial [Planctomycetaceae bacterium]